MQITKQSGLTGRIHTMEIPIDYEALHTGLLLRENGALIQDAFPHLSANEREFLMTGITPQEWEEAFGQGE